MNVLIYRNRVPSTLEESNEKLAEAQRAVNRLTAELRSSKAGAA